MNRKVNRQLITQAIRALGTQEALAAELGVSQGTISKWLRGVTQPSLVHALALERLTSGQVRAAELRPDYRDLIERMGSAAA